MKKITLLLSSVVIGSVMLYGQSSRRAMPLKHSHNIHEKTISGIISQAPKSPDGTIRCLTVENEKIRQAIGLKTESDEQFENWIAQKIKELPNNPLAQKASRNIPVVVHVIHDGDAVGSGENISVAQVNSQITVLNADYSATNTDFANVPSAFQSVATNPDIQFCLATIDPNGLPTSGIDRVNYSTASFGSSATESMKAATSWDPTKYFNIWVLRFGGDLNGVLGYAQFPSTSGLTGLPSNGGNANTDGIAIDYRYFGTTGTVSAPYNKGRTVTHETGHWLGLRHIWGEDGAGGCGSDDYVTDTPNQEDENYGCPSYPSNASCSNGGDMSMNYMDYSNDACMYMFTNGQKTRFNAVLTNSPRRNSLLTSNVCGAATINANFSGTPLTINEGQTVAFTDASYSPNTLNSWSWTFTGGTPATHNGQTPPAITYNTAGTYAVSLTVTDNLSGTDTETKNAYITVNPAGQALCDSFAAGFNWNTDQFYTGAYWSADLCTPNDGYIMGNNCYDDNGWASKVTFSGTNKEITDLIYLFDQSTGTGTGNLKLWNANGAGGSPSTVLFSQPITTGQFSANLHQLILVPVSPAVSITGNFFIGNDHTVTPLDGDTLTMAVADATTNQTWAKETSGWKDLAAYSVNFKGTVAAIICDKTTGVLSHTFETAEVLVQPNPTSGIISVIAPKEVTNFNVVVYNMLGEQVVTEFVNSNVTKLNLDKQPNGVYFVKVSANGQVTTKKIILSK